MTTPIEVQAELVARALAGGARIERAEVAGRLYWIKRPERLSLRMRLQKGDPAAAFAAEVAAHLDFAARGLPVPRVAAQGPGYLVTEDAGPSLRDLRGRLEPEAFRAALGLAAAALARMHAAGVSHGRPSLKDICLAEGEVTFLDLERAGRGGVAMDVAILLFSTAVETGNDAGALEAVREGYLGAGGAGGWAAAERLARRMAPLAWALWPVRRALRGNREFDAVGPVMGFLRG